MSDATRYARRYHWLSASVADYVAREERPESVVRALSLPPRHHVIASEDVPGPRLGKILLETYERRPETFERLLALPGVGAKTVRALSLAAEIMYGVPATFRDPAAFSFAHGGKDGHPYPVHRRTYDATIHYLETAVRRARVGDRERLDALRRLETLQRSA
jgi:hypothetical protein